MSNRVFVMEKMIQFCKKTPEYGQGQSSASIEDLQGLSEAEILRMSPPRVLTSDGGGQR